MRWAADKPHFTAWDGHIMGHHLKRQYTDHTEKKALGGKKREGTGGVLYRVTEIANSDLNCDKKIANSSLYF